MKYKCWDYENERWIYEGEEGTEFIYYKGKWKVTYQIEINKPGSDIDGVERDVPVIREVDYPVVMEVGKWYEVLAYKTEADVRHMKFEFITDGFTDDKDLALECGRNLLSEYHAVTVQSTDLDFCQILSNNEIEASDFTASRLPQLEVKDRMAQKESSCTLVR